MDRRAGRNGELQAGVDVRRLDAFVHLHQLVQRNMERLRELPERIAVLGDIRRSGGGRYGRAQSARPAKTAAADLIIGRSMVFIVMGMVPPWWDASGSVRRARQRNGAVRAKPTGVRITQASSRRTSQKQPAADYERLSFSPDSGQSLGAQGPKRPAGTAHGRRMKNSNAASPAWAAIKNSVPPRHFPGRPLPADPVRCR